MRDQIQRFRSMFDSEATSPLERQDVAREDEDPLTTVANMSEQEIREYLPLVQKELEVLESEFDELMNKKDTMVMLIAGMHAKLDALTEGSRRDDDPQGLSRVRER